MVTEVAVPVNARLPVVKTLPIVTLMKSAAVPPEKPSQESRKGWVGLIDCAAVKLLICGAFGWAKLAERFTGVT